MVLAAGGMHLLDLHFNFLQKENIKICSYHGRKRATSNWVGLSAAEI